MLAYHCNAMLRSRRQIDAIPRNLETRPLFSRLSSAISTHHIIQSSNHLCNKISVFTTCVSPDPFKYEYLTCETQVTHRRLWEFDMTYLEKEKKARLGIYILLYSSNASLASLLIDHFHIFFYSTMQEPC